LSISRTGCADQFALPKDVFDENTPRAEPLTQL
jgi:hypothetical protein